MAFAIFYNPDDLTKLENAIRTEVQRLPKADRDLANAFWTGGLSGWRTSTVVCPEPFAGGDAACRTITISGSFQGQLTRQRFIDLCWRIHAAMPAGDPKGQFDAIISDIASGAGSAEPWP